MQEDMDAPASSPPEVRKRAYSAPELQLLGTVRELTAGGSAAGIENDPFGCNNSTLGPMGPCKP